MDKTEAETCAKCKKGFADESAVRQHIKHKHSSTCAVRGLDGLWYRSKRACKKAGQEVAHAG